MPLKGYNEQVPIGFAKKLIVDESPFCKYLYDNKALAIRHIKSKAIMECYATKVKYLTPVSYTHLTLPTTPYV